MLSRSNEELANSPLLAIGDVIHCTKCGELHTARGGVNRETGEETDDLLVVHCQRAGATFLVGINGRRI